MRHALCIIHMHETLHGCQPTRYSLARNWLSSLPEDVSKLLSLVNLWMDGNR